MVYNDRSMDRDKKPLISVIITNYNYGKYISAAIDSVLNQSYKNIELIVIDDGSTDDSVEIIESYKNKYPEIVIVYRKNKGVVYTRNEALSLVKGEFFIFVDADDTIPKKFISEMYATAKASKADVVCCDLETEAILKVEPISLVNLLMFNATPICQLVRVENLPPQARFDNHLDKLGHEDIDFFFSLYERGLVFAKCHSTIYKYNVHGEGRSPRMNGLTEKHYEARVYIYNKYISGVERKSLTDALIEALIEKDNKIIEWIDVAADRMDLIQRFQEDQKIKENIIKSKNEQVDELNVELANIKNARSYRIVRTIEAPIKAVKKLKMRGLK